MLGPVAINAKYDGPYAPRFLNTNSASYVTKDLGTKGSWTGVYGTSGYSIANHEAKLPAYARVAVSKHGSMHASPAARRD